MSLDIAIKNLSNRAYRLDNLYSIINKTGSKIPFKMNWAQKELYNDIWYKNIILKARQLGLSTFLSVLFLDACLFNSYTHAGIIAHTREDAEALFKRVKFAYDNLDEGLKSLVRATADSARELQFSNGSNLRVGTSMRSATLQYLHISEFGKICAKYPDKAEEIVTGSLNTVSDEGHVFIESTAEGSGGYFYEMCTRSKEMEKLKSRLSKADYKFFFFPWWKEPAYILNEMVFPKKDIQEYFDKMESEGIMLSDAQKAWYVKKYDVLGDGIYQEFPSNAEEAFRGSASGTFYGKQIVDARIEKRICHIPYDRSVPVHTAWDLGGAGGGDYTAIWFFQVCGKEIHLIDYYQDNGKSLSEYIYIVRSKPYIYGEHLAPHDIGVHEYSSGISRIETARQLGFRFSVVGKNISGERIKLIEGIDAVRMMFPRCWFDEKKCEEGIRMLENYRKEWDERLNRWSDKPVHDFASNGSDAFRYLAIGLPQVEKTSGSIENDIKALRSFWG